jgi:kynurenine 3-monooxygenase
MRPERLEIAVIGGGLAGSLLAITLAQRGFRPIVFERRARYDATEPERGRSINLALAARGIAALDRCGIYAEIEPLVISMRGRMIHEHDSTLKLLRYGQRDSEQIFSISRTALNRKLYEIATRRHGVEYQFDSPCIGIDAGSEQPIIETHGRVRTLDADIVFAVDGAGSAIRGALEEFGALAVSDERLGHGYKELAIAPAPSGGYAIDPHALHIWPRGNYMLIALPNTDGSFTATLFLPLDGRTSFASIGADDVSAFFCEQFPDAVGLLGSLEEEYADNPTGLLGTIRCSTWTFDNRYLLLGDAAHAIVPFHGQGMNAAFEDVATLDELLDAHGDDFQPAFEAFERSRRADVLAIADMALENYAEMRQRVRDPDFAFRQQVAFELERRFPDRFIPRYSMVMFHPEISYAEARRRGFEQDRTLSKLCANASRVMDVDFELAERLVGAA